MRKEVFDFMTKFKHRLLSLSASALLICTMLPVSASATETTAPKITQMSIAGQTSTADANGNLYLTLPANTSLAGKNFSVTTSDAVDFVAATAPAAGELYASSVSDNNVTLNFNISAGNDVDLNTSTYAINVSSTDKTEWSGTFSSTYDQSMSTLASALNMSGATLRADTFVSGTTGNASRSIRCNEDAANVQMIVYDPDTTLHTITYNYGSGSYIWTVPDGATLTQPTLPSNLKLDKWYTDAEHTQEATFGGAVTSDVTLYATLISVEDTSDFATALARKDSVLYIKNTTDWDSFVNNASTITSAQRVELLNDIDCNNAAYTALTFAGDFNGNNHTIKNATFSQSGGNNGLFAKINAGQKVANLKLDNLTIKYASTYAGVLAGQVYGGEGNRALVQNVQVTNSSVSGRSAAGITGFTIFADVNYCSCKGTSVTGMANGAGIVGINYGIVSECYSTVTATALSTKGGITGKNLEGGKVVDCWCTMSSAAGNNADCTNVMTSVNANTTKRDMQSWGRNLSVWSFASGTNTTFISDETVSYPFT